MLQEIRCEIFEQKVINFRQGLNVVLGDNSGSNSIGKSTLLMIIDFIFGGSTYITHNKDVVSQLGHHEFFFIFKFKEVEFHFSRSTEEPDQVYRCRKDFKKLEDVKLDDYCNLLKRYYGLESEDLSFRSAISLFSRIWGKNNYDVKRLLHGHHSEKNLDTVGRLIKLFNEYDKIAQEDKELKSLTTSKTVLNKAGKLKFIPRISKSIYEKNLKEINKIRKEIEDWSKSAYSPTINISEIISDELIQLKEQKNFLLKEREYYKARYSRTNKTITKSTDVEFETLLEFFPNVNMEKLAAIESFHNGISSILSKELERAKKELKQKNEALDEEIQKINNRMEEVLNPLEQPNLFIDTLLDASSKLKNLQLENDYYQKLQSVSDNVAAKTTALAELKETIIKKIMNDINVKLNEINNAIHKDKRTSPALAIAYNNYEYNYFDNTGTGKAYANLIIFDLAMITLTELPILIHDSFLFKNIEKAAVEQIIRLYNAYQKQIFIAIDVIDMYSENTQKTLKEQKVIQLSKDKLLFTKDWRDL